MSPMLLFDTGLRSSRSLLVFYKFVSGEGFFVAENINPKPG